MATFLIGSHYNYLEANWTVSIALKDTYIRAKRNGTERRSKEHHPSLHQGHYAGKWGHYGDIQIVFLEERNKGSNPSPSAKLIPS